MMPIGGLNFKRMHVRATKTSFCGKVTKTIFRGPGWPPGLSPPSKSMALPLPTPGNFADIHSFMCVEMILWCARRSILCTTWEQNLTFIQQQKMHFRPLPHLKERLLTLVRIEPIATCGKQEFCLLSCNEMLNQLAKDLMELKTSISCGGTCYLTMPNNKCLRRWSVVIHFKVQYWYVI